jgi:hypothetical protein
MMYMLIVSLSYYLYSSSIVRHLSDRSVMDEINYISYKLISEDPVLAAKAEELDELYRAEKQLQRSSKKDTLTAFNSILTAIEVMGAMKATSYIYQPIEIFITVRLK